MQRQQLRQGLAAPHTCPSEPEARSQDQGVCPLLLTQVPFDCVWNSMPHLHNISCFLCVVLNVRKGNTSLCGGTLSL